MVFKAMVQVVGFEEDVEPFQYVNALTPSVINKKSFSSVASFCSGTASIPLLTAGREEIRQVTLPPLLYISAGRGGGSPAKHLSMLF